MSKRSVDKFVRMRQLIRKVDRDLVEKLCQISREEMEYLGQFRFSTPNVLAPAFGTPFAIAPPGRIRPQTVQAFVESRTPQEQAEIRGLYWLGRDSLFMSAKDFAIACGDYENVKNYGEYLGGKSNVALYLGRGADLIGL
jgi:hypothetical protein